MFKMELRIRLEERHLDYFDWAQFRDVQQSAGVSRLG